MHCTDAERVKPVASLQEFFRDSVTQAMRRQGVQADDHTAHYVVSLLTVFARSEAFFEEVESGIGVRPLALMLADAAEAARPEEKAFTLQRLGDVSLFIAGFFADGLADKPVDVDYYVYMGGGAYHSLSQQLKHSRRGSTFGPVFDELANKFKEFVDVLNDIRSEARPANEQDILRLYEIWLRTGSRRAERLLRTLGVEPNASLDGRSRH
jgi:hypothetical protein